MSVARTDDELSLESNEYEWSKAGLNDMHRYVMPTLLRWLSENQEQSILDIGCGNGALTDQLARRGYQCTGIDMSKSGIDIAKRSYPNLTFFASDLERPLSSQLQDAFDVIVSVEVIEHLLLPRQLFSRAKEALKRNGELVITTPYHGYWKNLLIALTGKFDDHWHPLRDYGHVKFFSTQTLSKLFEEQGFELTHVKRVGRIPPVAKSLMMRGRLRS